ncbi:cache domain-containing sensor histidine kinase [Jeotgalibacillus soli]|uniref:histidine kinase n=1 Tax=Jeotgalibacillus soli TaxID=889306 RepID=A0A0C2SDV6_9BACL|nr:sensor histidine kinase [Jeotgalibacillus soli]KIL52134.1 histidine kinase [Jeotgalibacillus soli]
MKRIVSLFNNLSIKDKFFTITISILSVFCLMSILIVSYVINLYEQKIYEESAEVLHLSSTILEQEIKKVENISFQFSTDNRVQEYLSYIKENPLDYESYQYKIQLRERMTTLATQERYVASIELIDATGEEQTVGFNTKVINEVEDMFPALNAARGANVWFGKEEESILLSARQLRGKSNINLQHYGYLTIALDMNILMREILNLSPNRNFVISKNGEIIYTNNEFTEYDFLPASQNNRGYEIKTVNNEKLLITHFNSRNPDLTYYNIINFDEITSQTELLRNLLMLLFVITFLLAMYISRRAARGISKPLEQLTKKMKKVQEGDFEQVEGLSSSHLKDEIGVLHKNFEIMLNRINELIKENYMKQLMIKETEYKALEAQINPHFLYNTLDSINWMAKSNKQKAIAEMVESLGNMMRNIISKKEPLITIKEELEIVHDYMRIQTYRFRNRLNFTINILPEIEKCSMPKLTIQPIVENAIQHGLENMVTDCYITVSTQIIGDDIAIMVKDNGGGMDKETIHAVMKGNIKSRSSGIGVHNINERIKLMYGDQYGINISSEVNKGTTVTISLPFKRGDHVV